MERRRALARHQCTQRHLAIGPPQRALSWRHKTARSCLSETQWPQQPLPFTRKKNASCEFSGLAEVKCEFAPLRWAFTLSLFLAEASTSHLHAS